MIYESNGRLATGEDVKSLFLEDVSRPVTRFEVSCCYENDIDECPNSQATEAEQLADPLLPVAEIETIHPEATQCDAQHQRS